MLREGSSGHAKEMSPADGSGKGQTAATAPETLWGQSRCGCWALPLLNPLPGSKAQADTGSKTSTSPTAA